MKAKDLHQLITQNHPPRWQASRSDEIEQGLRQLGYLQHNSKRAFRNAIAQFRADYWQAGLLADAPPVLSDTAVDEVTPAELELLRRLLALDGDYIILKLPQKGSTNLDTRIIHYRLFLLGLWKKEIAASYSTATQKAIEQLQDWFAWDNRLIDTINFCGNITELIKAINRSGVLRQMVVCFSYKNPAITKDLMDELQEEQEDKEDSSNLLRSERSAEQSLRQLDEEISGKEAAMLYAIENRTKNKRQRLERIKWLIDQCLAEQKALLQQRLKAEQALLDSIQSTTSKAQKRKLNRQLQRLRAQRETEQAQRQRRLQQLVRRLQQLQQKVNGLRFRFKARLKDSLDRKTYTQLKKIVFQRHDKQYLKQLSTDQLNQFLIRLLQIHQWMNGYYFGKLDSAFGNRTFEALVDFTEDLPNIKLKYILTRLGGAAHGYWLVNIAYLFERFAYAARKDGRSHSATELLKTYQKSFNGQDNELLNAATDKAWLSFTEDIRQGIRLEGLIRGCYMGVKSLARSIGRVIGRLIFFVKKQIQQLSNLFKNFIRIMYSNIREGLLQYGLGIGYLLLTRQITGLNVKTVDNLLAHFDTKNKQATAAVEGELAEGTDAPALGKASRLRSGIVLALKVLRWGLAIASGPISWPRVGLQIAFVFRNMIKKRMAARTRAAQLAFAG